MFKDKNKRLIFYTLTILLIFNGIYTFISINSDKKIRDMILMEEAKSVVTFFKSFRRTYQRVFVENHIELNEDTINLLPVKTSNEINEKFSELVESKVVLRTVSERARNPENFPNEKESEAIQKFNNDTTLKYIFDENNDYVYNYYEPIYIAEMCLKCHGKREEAPKIISDRYTTAFDYKLGELRGILSLQIDKSDLLTVIDHNDNFDNFYILMNMIVLTIAIIVLYIRLNRNHEESKNVLLGKNSFLERKAKEFQDLQNAIGTSEIISKTDKDGVITYANEKFCEVSGYSLDELLGKNHNIIRHPDTKKEVFQKMWETIKNKKVYKSVIKNKRKDGSSYHVDTTIVPLLDEDNEIEEFLACRHYVEDMMNHKVLLQDLIKQYKNSLLILVKLEAYEELEELYTDDVITKLEEKFVNSVLENFPENCLFTKVYKLEHGEFAFIEQFDDGYDLKQSVSNIKDFQENVRIKKFLIDGYEFNPRIIISYAVGKSDVFESARLGLKKLIKEKRNFIDATGLLTEIREKAEKNIETINMIKKAIETNRIVSYYQPIYNKNKEIKKYESLVRLIDEENKVISPLYFLETAKKANYYSYITKIVIDNSIEMLSKVKEDISINLSFLDIEDKETSEYIYEKFANSNESNRITIELLEDEAVKNFNIITEFIFKVKAQGVKIAIDDFGAGYSNFERLSDFQPDILKIDGSLVKNIDTDKYNRSLVETIHEFAKREGIETVAEFVHSEEILKIVKEIGIDYSQGFHLGEPKEIS